MGRKGPKTPEQLAKDRAYYREQYAQNKAHFADKHRKRKYGLSREEYLRMLAEQDGGCAICGTKDPGVRSFCVDHDHETGEIRGLLCFHCNIGIGHLQDDPWLLRRAAEYLEVNDGD